MRCTNQVPLPNKVEKNLTRQAFEQSESVIMIKSVLISSIAIVLAVLIGVSIAVLGPPDTQVVLNAVSRAVAATAGEPSEGKTPAPPTVEYAVVEKRKLVQWQEYTGRFEAIDAVNVRARVSGYIDAVHFKAGQRVEKGDKLVTIDPRPFEAAVSEAEARVLQAKSAARFAEAELQRAKPLAKDGYTSQSVFDQRTQQVESAKAAVGVAEAQLARSRLDLGFTNITAPVSGRISNERVTPGNLVEGGAQSPVLTTIVSVSPIYFYFDATEQQLLSRIRESGGAELREKIVNAQVEVRLIDEPDFKNAGKVDFVDNKLDEATGTIRARAVFDNSAEIFAPGMFGRLRLAEPSQKEVALVPDKAIGTDQTQKFVWVLDDANKAHRRNVNIGQKRGVLRVVTSGLEDGERVVTSGLHLVASGREVRPKPTEVAGGPRAAVN